jgi:hypothetical protein
MPVWASLVVTLGAWPLLLALMVYFVMRLTAFPRNTERPAEAFPSSAQERSLALLKEVLEEHEYEQLTRRGYLDISSPSNSQRIYRIRRNAGLVSLFEQGRAIRELCVQPTEPLPNDDVVVMHKLMIQGNEQEYLARANQFPSLFPRQRYRP